MSFSSDLKAELCEIKATQDCCQRAEAYGMLLFGRTFDTFSVSLMTEYDFIAQRYADSFTLLTGFRPHIQQTKAGKYVVEIRDRSEILLLLNELGYSGKETGIDLLPSNIENDCCFGAFLRGVFLASGVITDPAKEYHLEFDVSRLVKAKSLQNFLAHHRFAPKLSARGGSLLVYYKDSEQIEELIGLMGGQKAYLEFLGQKVYKDVRNRVNRKVNCDNANIRKTSQASARQIAAIHALIRADLMRDLPDDLQELAVLRLNEPELTLTELGQRLKVPASRSYVDRRLRKLISLAEAVNMPDSKE